MELREPRPARFGEINTSVRLVAVMAAYFILGRLGLALHSVHTVASLIWPPSGLALAAFVLYGNRVWPGVFIAALAVNLTIGLPFLVAVGIAAGNTLGPWMGARFLSSHFPEVPLVEEPLRIVLAALLIPVFTASGGTVSSWLGGVVSASDLFTTWSTWWLGDMLGILICTPFLLAWFARTDVHESRSYLIELFTALLGVTLVSFVVFWLPHASFAYYIFIPLTWAALRTGTRGTSLSMLIVAIIATTGALLGYGRFAAEGLLNLQIFLAVTGCILLAFTSVVEERRKVHEALQKRATELEQALADIRFEDQAKKEFIDILAHELRNPLATILSSIELIQMQGLTDANSPSLLTTINERSRAMVRLLDDLLDISRISKNKLALHKETIPMRQFTHKLMETVVPLMKRYGHEFSITPATEELYVRADPVRLEQILLNLLANAARITKMRGFIHVLFVREGRKLAIHIRDSGVGIPHGMIRRIFEPFFHVDPEQVSVEGIGVGLTLTRELIEMHGGSIEATRGEFGSGSEVIVRLPLMKPPEEEVPPPHPSAASRTENYTRMPRPLTRSYRILVVDDNHAAGTALSQLLQLRGNITRTADSGADALLKAAEFNPEVIFLDIGLPDMTGYDVATKLRETRKPYFIVALSGYGQEADKEKARRVGIDHYLTKPAGLKEIQAVLRKVPRAKDEEV